MKSEAPTITGNYDAVTVTKEVRARLSAIRACYERELRRSEKLGGRLVVRWTITADGRSNDVGLAADALGDADLGRCVTGLVSRWRFALPPEGPVIVLVPFVFEPAS